MGFVSIIVMMIFGMIVGISAGGEGFFAQLLSAASILALALFALLFQFLYFGYFWSRNGESVGMIPLSIKVVRRNGRPLSFVRAGLRGTVGYWISGLFLGLGYLWAAVDGNKEAWHDKIFDTWVVRT